MEQKEQPKNNEIADLEKVAKACSLFGTFAKDIKNGGGNNAKENTTKQGREWKSKCCGN